jgi:hypothetical protein
MSKDASIFSAEWLENVNKKLEKALENDLVDIETAKLKIGAASEYGTADHGLRRKALVEIGEHLGIKPDGKLASTILDKYTVEYERQFLYGNRDEKVEEAVLTGIMNGSFT